jgi:two-component system sensor histidine kinase UhpB
MSLFARVCIANIAVFVAAGLALALSPVTVSSPIALIEAVVLTGCLTALILLNVALIRPAFAPLERLAEAMRSVDLLRPGARLSAIGSGEVAQVATAFNEMLERLEQERRHSSARALLAQEAERRRVAQELHDEVGQTLTAVLLQLKQAARRAPPGLVEELSDAQEVTRASLQEVRRIAQDLRPEALDLGLRAALTELCTAMERRTGVRVERSFEQDLPSLDPEVSLVMYRVAQESLTNVARHAGATTVELRLERVGHHVALVVDDDGRGLAVRQSEGRGGIRGMQERALLVDGTLSLGPSGLGGLCVRLEVPTRTRGPS